MTGQILHEVLEATGYLENGAPAHGVCLNGDARRRRTRTFSPDASWQSGSALTVYFKAAPEPPPDEKVAEWRREIWNQGFSPLLWVVSPEKIDLYNGFGRPLDTGDANAHRLRTFQRIEKELDVLDALAGRLAMETGRFWLREPAVNRGTSVDRQLLSDLAALERGLVEAQLDRPGAQGLIGRSVFTQFLIDRGIVGRRHLETVCGHGTFPAVLRDRPATERLFAWLRDVFNGDMFPPEEPLAPVPEHLRRVADFLEAVDPETRQARFFPYQFDVIPVELISSIYEQFVHADHDAPGRDSNTDVFYTRMSLVSLVLDEIMEGAKGCRY